MRTEPHYATGTYASPDYETTSQSVRKETALDRISDHASTAARIGDLMQEFIDRCRGGRPEEGVASDRPSILGPTGHFAQLERLEKNLARAEELARELGSIG